MCFTNKPLLLPLIIASLFISACGKSDQAEKSKTETQVVAKVNGDEISIHQVNFQLARMGQVSEAQSKQATKQILTRLVDQQLLKQQAIETKLDRDPKILQALESSRDEILAQAYLDTLIAKAAKPSKEEIDKFYQENPELFESRRVFRLQELAIDVDKAKLPEVEASLKDVKTISEIAKWLKENNYPFTANTNIRAAEQLPLGMLKKLHGMNDGDLILVPTESSLNVLHLAASQSKPLSREDATPFIEQYFINQNKTKLAKQEMEALKTKAKIEYVGAFAEANKANAISPAKDDTATKAPAEASESQSSIDKGLSGLK